jgi:hypothetical protein
MKKPLYYLDEYEKSRIIGLHEHATKKQYLGNKILLESFIFPVWMWKTLGVAAGVGAGVYFYRQWKESSGKNSFEKLGEFCTTQDLSKLSLLNSDSELNSIVENLRDAVEITDINPLKFFTGSGPEGTTDEEKIRTNLSKIKSIPDYCEVSKIYKMKYGEDLTRRLTSEVDLDFAKTIREPLSKAIETSAGSGVDFEDGKVDQNVSPGTGGNRDDETPDKTNSDDGITYKNCSSEYGYGCKDLPYTDTIKKMQKCLGIEQTGKFDGKTETELKSATGRSTINKEGIALLCGDF